MYETVIGLEIHAQLRTATKLFCACAAVSGGAPNTQTCPVCLGMPGVLPVLNGRAVDQAITVALLLGCEIQPVSVFARKNYFYPDLPKGYQITQYELPLARHGRLAWERGGRRCNVGIVRVHLEEDAGKSVHDEPGADAATSGLDFNRAGVPLAEIVTAPDLRSAEDAAECFRQLRAILVEAGVSDGNLEDGSLRCDANISVRASGSAALGARTEIKNLNSFRFLQRAIAYEAGRQRAVIEAGGEIVTATRLWDERRGVTEEMRTKEDSGDYRYFPEPDLPPLVVSDARVAALRTRVPELPEARVARLIAAYALGEDDATIIGASGPMARYFEGVAASARPAAAAQWVRGELTRRMHESGVGLEDVRVTPAALAGLIGLVDAGRLSVSAAKQVFARMFDTGEAPGPVAEAMGLALESDSEVVGAWIDTVLAAHADVVAQYRGGKRGALGYLAGLVIKASGGRAHPGLTDRVLRERLDGDPRP
jgi:aspartyl-tRNA(Asn)/glutamyl-tRNA(Gln) amidotransferase subunit B